MSETSSVRSGDSRTSQGPAGYTGQINRSGLPHGFGKQYCQNGDVYDGNWSNGKPHGRGIYQYASGASYEGGFNNGIRHGRGKYAYANGQVYEGGWENGKRHGKGILCSNRNVPMTEANFYEGDFADGHQHGQGTLRLANGDSFQGNFVEGKRKGNGVLLFANGNKYQGQWLDDVPHGFGAFSVKELRRHFVGVFSGGQLADPRCVPAKTPARKDAPKCVYPEGSTTCERCGHPKMDCPSMGFGQRPKARPASAAVKSSQQQPTAEAGGNDKPQPQLLARPASAPVAKKKEEGGAASSSQVVVDATSVSSPTVTLTESPSPLKPATTSPTSPKATSPTSGLDVPQQNKRPSSAGRSRVSIKAPNEDVAVRSRTPSLDSNTPSQILSTNNSFMGASVTSTNMPFTGYNPGVGQSLAVEAQAQAQDVGREELIAASQRVLASVVAGLGMSIADDKATDADGEALTVVRVVEVAADGPAADIPLARGDYIMTFNGHPIKTKGSLMAATMSVQPGAVCTLGYVSRDGSVRRKVKVVMGCNLRAVDRKFLHEVASLEPVGPSFPVQMLNRVQSIEVLPHCIRFAA